MIQPYPWELKSQDLLVLSPRVRLTLLLPRLLLRLPDLLVLTLVGLLVRDQACIILAVIITAVITAIIIVVIIAIIIHHSPQEKHLLGDN
jgi:hypothetical protein